MTTQAFRLRPIMKQGTASSIPETWTHYASLETARTGAKTMYHNDRVLHALSIHDCAVRRACCVDGNASQARRAATVHFRLRPGHFPQPAIIGVPVQLAPS